MIPPHCVGRHPAVSPGHWWAPPFAILRLEGDLGPLATPVENGIALGFDHYRSTPSNAVWSSLDPWQMEAKIEKGNFDPLVFYQSYLRWLDPVGNSLLVAAADYENPQWESLWELADPDILEGDVGPILQWAVDWYWTREAWLAENPGFLGRYIRPTYDRFPITGPHFRCAVRCYNDNDAGGETWEGDWYFRRSIDNAFPAIGFPDSKPATASSDATMVVHVEPLDAAYIVQVTTYDNADPVAAWTATGVDLNDNVLLPQTAGSPNSEFVLFRLLWPME